MRWRCLQEKDAINAKILKDVKFPLELDVFDLCTPELQAKLQPIRDRFKAADDAAVTKAKAAATIASVRWTDHDLSFRQSGMFV